MGSWLDMMVMIFVDWLMWLGLIEMMRGNRMRDGGLWYGVYICAHVTIGGDAFD